MNRVGERAERREVITKKQKKTVGCDGYVHCLAYGNGFRVVYKIYVHSE